jgi:anti-sigma-K factor RskA
MNAHQPFAADLALYALNELKGDARVAVETHLRDCPDCRTELERVRGDLALLAFSTSGPRPPSRSRERLMSAMAKEPRRVQVRRVQRNVWWSGVGWAAATAALVAVLWLVHQNRELERHLAGVEARSAGQQEKFEQAKQLLATLTSQEAARFVLVAGQTPPQPQGRAIYLSSSGSLVFLASNMADLPPHKVYELWLIPTTGSPIPAGIFRPNPQGSAAVVKPALPVGVEAKTFAITVEPEAGSSAPTSQPIMVGTRG